jgi:hypothetical protein
MFSVPNVNHRKPFRITLLPHLVAVSSLESHSYKKMGGTPSPGSFAAASTTALRVIKDPSTPRTQKPWRKKEQGLAQSAKYMCCLSLANFSHFRPKMPQCCLSLTDLLSRNYQCCLSLTKKGGGGWLYRGPFCGLAFEEESLWELTITADLEGTEVLVPKAFRRFRFGFAPKLEFVKIVYGDLTVSEAIE